ncbi:hypothetical protein P7C70_g24, partial [Phenoliferia sp. Uapishka_3]
MAPKRKSEDSADSKDKEKAPSKASKASKAAKVDPLKGLTKSSFLANATAFTLSGVDDTEIEVKPQKFKPGSLGWSATGKTTIKVDGHECPVGYTINFTVSKSADLPEGSDGSDDEEAVASEEEEAEEEAPKKKKKSSK